MSKEIVLDIETRDTFQDVGAYNPTLLHVSLVGVYFYETDTYESFLQEELPKLWPRLEKADRIIGYNIIGFDFPCLQMLYQGTLANLPTIDLLKEIEKRIGFRIKLDDVAQATLGIGKSGTGLMAVEYWKRGEIDKLRDYCLQDVKVTREVYEAAKKTGEVSFLDKQGQKRTISLPIEEPVPQSRPAINLTLGF